MHHQPESGGMRKGSADALLGDGEVSGGGAGSRAEDKLHAGAGGDRERLAGLEITPLGRPFRVI